MGTTGDAASLAVERALAKQRGKASLEVDKILDATLAVIARCAPSSPRVSDIVLEAGLSNQSFYRYFSGKDELLLAVYDRGMQRLRSYLDHRMESHRDPSEKVRAWIRGIMAQVTDPTAAIQGLAVERELNWPAQSGPTHLAALAGLGLMLVPALTEGGSATPELDAHVIQEAAAGTMRKHLIGGTVPNGLELDHLEEFCLRGINW